MNKTTKIIIGIIVILLVIWGLISVNKNNQVSTDEPIKIGVIAPLTGNFAVLGERMKNGFELAKEDILKSGKIESIDLVIEDACQPAQAVSAAHKLIEIDKVHILGGSFCVVGFVPVVPIFEQAKILTFNTAPNPDSVLNKKYVISTNSSIKEKSEQIAQYAYEKLNAKTAAVIYYNTPLGQDYNKYLSETFKKFGGNILSSEVTLVDATDFRTPLTKIKSMNADVIFVVQLANPLGNLLKQAKELGVKSVIVGNSQNEDPTILQTAGIAAEGFTISSDEPFPKTDKINDFAKRYEEKFGQPADVFAANSYDALHLQIEAYLSCNGETECMLEKLHSIKNYPGVSGNITIREDGSASKPTIFKVVKNGQFVRADN